MEKTGLLKDALNLIQVIQVLWNTQRMLIAG
jgi:hypothetical protein